MPKVPLLGFLVLIVIIMLIVSSNNKPSTTTANRSSTIITAAPAAPYPAPSEQIIDRALSVVKKQHKDMVVEIKPNGKNSYLATIFYPTSLKGFPLLNAMAELQTTEVVRAILKELMAAGFSPMNNSFTVSCYAHLRVKGETGADLFHPLGKSRYNYNTDSIQWSTGIW